MCRLQTIARRWPCRGAPLLARLTRRSAQRLDLVPGQRVWARIKAVALVG